MCIARLIGRVAIDAAVVLGSAVGIGCTWVAVARLIATPGADSSTARSAGASCVASRACFRRRSRGASRRRSRGASGARALRARSPCLARRPDDSAVLAGPAACTAGRVANAGDANAP